jgi:hypothetical protein
MIRAFAVVSAVLSIGLSAFAHAQSPPKLELKNSGAGTSATSRSGACGLGVVVGIGDEFMVQTRGLVVFQNKAKAVPIESWGLGDLIFARVRAAAPPGVTVLRIPYSKARFPPREAPKGQWFRNMKAELVELMREITNGTSCQRYILVSKSLSTFGTSNWTVGGLGIVDQDVLVGRRIYLFALSYIRVFDGRDFSIIRHGSALTNFDPFLKQRLLGAQVLGPYRELPVESFPGRPEDAAGDLALRDGVRAMLTESLDKTLPFMLRPSPSAR